MLGELLGEIDPFFYTDRKPYDPAVAEDWDDSLKEALPSHNDGDLITEEEGYTVVATFLKNYDYSEYLQDVISDLSDYQIFRDVFLKSIEKALADKL